jgi:DNA-binding MarR family transcriptional regulator
MNIPIGADQCYCLATRRAARRLSRTYDLHLASTGLSINQFSILALVKDHPGIPVADLAHLMAMERTSLVRAIKPLRDAAFLDAIPSGAKSALTFVLSDAGTAKLHEAEGHWLAAQVEFEGQCGERQAKSVRSDLLNLVFAE